MRIIERNRWYGLLRDIVSTNVCVSDGRMIAVTYIIIRMDTNLPINQLDCQSPCISLSHSLKQSQWQGTVSDNQLNLGNVCIINT